MKASICTAFGPPEVLQLRDIEKPVPKKGEVLIHIHATSVGYGDLLARNSRNVSPRQFNMPFLFWIFVRIAFGLRTPKVRILGSEFAGTIESVGRNVSHFKPGDQVFGYLGQSMGGYAEYVCLPEHGVLTTKPASVTFAQAAVIPYGAVMALHMMRKANVREGQKVLIIGASGGIGSAAVQIARHRGAEVAGVCGSRNVDFVKSLGATRVIDYTQEDFTQSGETYDVIVDVLGRTPFSRCKQVLHAPGVCLYVSFKGRHLLQMLWTAMTAGKKGKKVVCTLAPGNRDDLLAVRELVETGAITASIDRVFPLGQAAAAHRYVEEGLAHGPVVIVPVDS